MATYPIKAGLTEKNWVITKDASGRVSDVSVPLTKTEYLDVIKTVRDPHSTFRNTSCVNLFKNGLATAREQAALDLLEATQKNNSQEKNSQEKYSKEAVMVQFLQAFDDMLSAGLSDLDESINGHFTNAEDKIKELKVSLASWKATINQDQVNTLIKQSKLTHQQKQFIQEDYSEMISSLNAGIAKFEKQLDAISESPSIDNVTLLLSPQDRGNIASLGNFLAQQTTAACIAAEKITGTINDNYIFDLVLKNPITTAFISARLQIREKNNTLAGVEFNDYYRAAKKPTALPDEALFSLMPFLEDSTPASLDKIICLISKTPLNQRSLTQTTDAAYILFRPFKALFNFIIAPASELFVMAPVRLITTPILAVFRPFYPNNIDAISDAIATFSLVPIAKALWNEQYKRLDHNGNPLNPHDGHQALLNAYKSNNSVFVSFFKTIYTPKGFVSAVTAVFNINPFATKPNADTRTGTDTGSNTDPETLFNQYAAEYDILKLRMDALINTSPKAIVSLTRRFPEPLHNRVENIKSPNRILCEIMHILNEDVCRNLIETMPGPALAYFAVSVGTLGAHFAPTAALGWMHGAPKYAEIVANVISKSSMGLNASASVSQGVLAAFLEWQIGIWSTQLMLEATSKDSTLLEKIAQHPEEILSSILIFSALGAAIGYIPKIPMIPSSNPLIANANVYGLLINEVTTTARKAGQGMLGVNCLTYGVIGLKCTLLLDSMFNDGVKSEESLDIERFISACETERILDKSDENERRIIVKAIAKQIGITNQHLILGMMNAVEASYPQHKQLSYDLEATHKHIKQLLATNETQINQILRASTTHRSPRERLEKAIKMLSDADAPLTFPAGKRDEAILFYNQLNKLFDEYNASEQGCTNPIPKEGYLLAFRNKHCQRTDFIGTLIKTPGARLLSFFPGNFPIAFRDMYRSARLGRFRLPLPWPIPEISFPLQFLLGTPTAYTRDSIAASNAKDVVLWHQWPSWLRGTAATIGIYLDKLIIAPAAIVVGSGITAYGLTIQAARFATRFVGLSEKWLPTADIHSMLQQLGRILAKNTPSTYLSMLSAHQDDNYADLQRRHVADAVRLASSFDGLSEAGDRITAFMTSSSSSSTELTTKALKSKRFTSKQNKPKQQSQHVELVGRTPAIVRRGDKKSLKERYTKIVSNKNDPLAQEKPTKGSTT